MEDRTEETSPFQAESQTLPIRRLTDDEAERLGFAQPLQLSRLQYGRFGYWRSSKWYCVETPERERRMTATKKELAVYDVIP